MRLSQGLWSIGAAAVVAVAGYAGAGTTVDPFTLQPATTNTVTIVPGLLNTTQVAAPTIPVTVVTAAATTRPPRSP